MKSPLFHLNKNFVSKSTKHQPPNKLIPDDYYKDFLYRKYLRGKLVKLINGSIIREAESSSESSSDEIDENIVITKPKSKGFVVKTFPNIIGSEVKTTKRKNDCFITPQELILNNFSKEEITLIKSDPGYFKLDLFEPFKRLELIKSKTLLQRLDDEDSLMINEKSQNKLRRKIVKINRNKETPKHNELTDKSLCFPSINLKKNPLENKLEKSSNNSIVSSNNNKTHSHKSLSSDFTIKFDKYIQRKNLEKRKISNSIIKKLEDKSEKYKRSLVESEKVNKENLLINEIKLKIKKSYMK